MAEPRFGHPFFSELGLKRTTIMKIAIPFAAAAIACATLLSGHAGAQGVPQTVELVKIDVQELAAGYRSTKVVGSKIVNDAGETIGKVEDILISTDGKRPYAILSIGGFLGMGTHLIAVPYDKLVFGDNKITLPGGTKDGLRMLPEFKFAAK
jgi:sporulation protein YlmC with PRC-barrel domain